MLNNPKIIRWTTTAKTEKKARNERSLFPPGSITVEDLLSVLPFGGRFDMVTLKGSTLKDAFEHSVRRYGEGSGELLQVGGTFSSFTCWPYYIWKPFFKNGMSSWPSLPCASHMPASRCCLSCVRLIEPLLRQSLFPSAETVFPSFLSP